jgi:Zn-dependent peptidase ImmA (M78 family)
VLPDWAEEAVSSKAGVLELTGFMIRHFGLELDTEGHLRRRILPEARFKNTQGTSSDQVEATRAAATAVARLSARAIRPPWAGIEPDAATTRNSLLAASSHGWIDFEKLLNYAWRSGIPVLYLPELPTDGRKMEGMVTFVGGRPVIVLIKKDDHPDWMLFILAHELGHLANRHLTEVDGQAIVDEAVNKDASIADLQEREANGYALQLLTAKQNGLQISGTIRKAPDLATAAINYGKANSISPGHVILNAVSNTRIHGQPLFALGRAALKLLPGEIVSGTTSDLSRAAARKYLDLDALGYDSVEYLEKLGVV